MRMRAGTIQALTVWVGISVIAAAGGAVAQDADAGAELGQERTSSSLIDHDLGFELVAPGPGWEIWDEAEASAIDPDACAGLWHLGTGVRALLSVRPARDMDRSELFVFYETSRKAQLLGAPPRLLSPEEPLHLQIELSREQTLRAELFVHTHGDAFAELEIAFAGELPQELRASLDGALRLVPELEPRWRARADRKDEFFPCGLLRAGRYLDLDVGFALAVPEDWRFLLPGDPLEPALEESCGMGHRERPLRALLQARRVSSAEQARRRERLAEAQGDEAISILPTPHGELLLRSSRERREREGVELEVERVEAWLGWGEWMLRFDLRGLQSSRAELHAALEALARGLERLPAEDLDARRAEHRAWLDRPEIDPESGFEDQRSLQRGTYENFAAGWSFRRRLADEFVMELRPGGSDPELVGWDARRELRFELRTRTSELELDAVHREAFGAEGAALDAESLYGPAGFGRRSWIEPDRAGERAWGCSRKHVLVTLPLRDRSFVELRLEAPAEHFAEGTGPVLQEILGCLHFDQEPRKSIEEHGEGWIDWNRGHALLPSTGSGWKRSGITRGWLVLASRAGSLRSRPVPFRSMLDASRRRREELELLAHAVVGIGRDPFGGATRELGAIRLGDLPARRFAFDVGPEGRKLPAELWIAWQGNQLHQLLLTSRPDVQLAPELSALALSFFQSL
ncbi:MAG: hypothetical protein IPN34_21845 [Planctomycetes bacterium]|nr:hypothetical protein [Planctomycetota bacterium]